jgi:hypothetical protein
MNRLLLNGDLYQNRTVLQHRCELPISAGFAGSYVTEAVEKLTACFDELSMNGHLLVISRLTPFALRLSKGEHRVFNACNTRKPI